METRSPTLGVLIEGTARDAASHFDEDEMEEVYLSLPRKQVLATLNVDTALEFLPKRLPHAVAGTEPGEEEARAWQWPRRGRDDGER